MKKIKVLACMLLLGSSLTVANCAFADLSKRIDATHILAREIELPERTRSNSIAGVSYADTNRNVVRTAKRLGQEEKFWIRNMASGSFEQINGVLRAIGKHCYIYVEDSQSVSQSAIGKIQKQFDEVIYPTNTAVFGAEARPGLDNDLKINLLMADIQDGYTNPEDGYVAGYFFAGDQMLQAEFTTNNKVKSNEREILYLDTYPCDPEASDYLEIVAHEFQHMIHHNQDKDEVTWVNEGCSQIAPVFCGFAPPGHYKLLKDDADRSLNHWAKWNPMPDYGQVYLWNQYIVDRILPDIKSRSTFFRALVSSKSQSIGGYISALKPFNYSFSDMFTDFSISNRINDPMLTDGRFAYRQKALKKFKLPPTRQVNTFPTKIQDSVLIWGSDSYTSDIGNISSRLKISFAGYRRFLGPTHPYFRLAAIMQDSSGTKKPEITMFKLDVNPADKNRLIGNIELVCDGSFDTLTIVVMALAPEDVDDAKYMPASGFIYDLNYETTSPIGTIAQASTNLNMQAFANAIAATADNYSDSAIKTREQYANLLIRTVKRDMEKGSLNTVDDFIETAADKALLAPFARDISSMLQFFKNQQSSVLSDDELQNRIDFLSEFR